MPVYILHINLVSVITVLTCRRHSKGFLSSHHSASWDTKSFVFWSVLLYDAANYWGAIASGCVPQHDIRTFFLSERPNILRTHKWHCHSTTVMRTRFLCISVYAEAWNVPDKRCLNILPLCANLQNTFPAFCSLFCTSYQPVTAIKKLNFLVSNFRRILNVVFFLLRDSPASEYYVPTFQNTLSVPYS
jgi:hypothetical protein